MARGAEQLVPLGAGERDAGARAAPAHAFEGVVVPRTTCIWAGCRVIQAVAIAIGGDAVRLASRSITAFSSGYSGLPRNGPVKKPAWNGDHACTVMRWMRQ